MFHVDQGPPGEVKSLEPFSCDLLLVLGAFYYLDVHPSLKQVRDNHLINHLIHS